MILSLSWAAVTVLTALSALLCSCLVSNAACPQEDFSPALQNWSSFFSLSLFLMPLLSFHLRLEISVIFSFLSLVPFAQSICQLQSTLCVYRPQRKSFVCIALPPPCSSIIIAHFDFHTFSLVGLPDYCIFPFQFFLHFTFTSYLMVLSHSCDFCLKNLQRFYIIFWIKNRFLSCTFRSLIYFPSLVSHCTPIWSIRLRPSQFSFFIKQVCVFLPQLCSCVSLGCPVTEST